MNTAKFLLIISAVLGVPLILTFYLYITEKTVLLFNYKSRKKVRPWLWLMPAFLLLLIFIIYPVFNTLVVSLMDKNSRGFIGFKNYIYIFTDREMLLALRNNFLWVLFFTSVTVVLGLILAVLTDRVSYEKISKAIIFLPMAISFVAAGVIWKFMYEYKPPGSVQIGTINAVMTAVVQGAEPKAWLFDKTYNNFALILVGIWIWTGFCVVVLSAGIKGISNDLIEAAKIDGANEFQIFWRIILPLLKPTLIVVATMMFINVLKIFDIIYIMTNGALDTEVIANRMYKEMFIFRNFGRAASIAVVLLLAVIPAMIINLKKEGK
ncbi:MAG: sugar ABC transporter permease [Spirochaetes bacterium]|nr:sugar ABC transporter permease [Spirochaetota bacterium]